eukprot:768369-Hanusia_phi.AAC.8
MSRMIERLISSLGGEGASGGAPGREKAVADGKSALFYVMFAFRAHGLQVTMREVYLPLLLRLMLLARQGDEAEHVTRGCCAAVAEALVAVEMMKPHAEEAEEQSRQTEMVHGEGGLLSCFCDLMSGNIERGGSRLESIIDKVEGGPSQGLQTRLQSLEEEDRTRLRLRVCEVMKQVARELPGSSLAMTNFSKRIAPTLLDLGCGRQCPAVLRASALEGLFFIAYTLGEHAKPLISDLLDVAERGLT